MKLKQFMFALVAMLLSFSSDAFAQQTVVVNSFAELKAEIEKQGGVARSNSLRTRGVAEQGDLSEFYGDIQLGSDIVMSDALEISNVRELTLDLNGHTISGDADKFIRNLGGFTVRDNSSAKNGGISCAIYNGDTQNDGAYLKIEGGTFKNKNAGAVVVTNYAVCEVSGGRFFSEGIALVNHESMTIDGGSPNNVYIEGKNHYITNYGTLAVNNATIAGAKDAYVGDKNDFGANVIFYNVAVNGKGYNSLSEAVANAVDGDLIRFFGDITEDAVVTINKDVTLDGNGKKLTSRSTGNAINVNAPGTVTITDITIEGAAAYALEATTAVEVLESTLSAGGALKVTNNKVFVQNSDLLGTGKMNVISVAEKVTFNFEGGSIKSAAQPSDENFFIVGGGCTGATFSIMADEIVLGGADNYLNIDTEANTVKVHSRFEKAFNEKGYATDKKGNFMFVQNAVARVKGTGKNYTTLAAALDAATNGSTVELLWADYKDPIAMNGTVAGNKTVTITGTAKVDWNKGFLFVGRNAEGNGKVIFDNANLTSISNSTAYGFNVSGSKLNDNKTNDGTVEIYNSTIELDYMLNKGTMLLVNSTLTVKNGFSVTGRKASESATGQDATATMTLTNGSKVVVNNLNGMGIGHEAYGVMSIDKTSSIETTQSFLVAAKGKMIVEGTANFAALTNNGQVNVAGGTVKVASGKTLANAGTVYVTGDATIDAKVTGAGWFYMNGVNLNAATKLDGAKVAFINGTNNVVGSTIKNGFFSVGVGQDAEAEKAVAFATANALTLGNVVVNVSENATIGGNGATYSGWVGSAYSADKAQHTYTLNVKNSQAAFGYMHVSKDGTLNVDGRTIDGNKYKQDGAVVDFYAGDFIVNGNVTLNNVDAWVKYTKMSVDHADGVLNITGDAKYESSIHNGGNGSASLKFWKAGQFNVAKGATVEVDNGTVLVDGAKLNISGNVTAKGAVTGNGAITLQDATAVYTAPANLAVVTDLENKMVIYKDGAYKVYDPAAKIGDVFYHKLQEAIDAAVNGDVITFVNDVTENVTIMQREGVNLTIDGGKKFTGVMTIDGGGRSAGAETLTIKNIEFHAVDGKDACITTAIAKGNGVYSYAHNVTVENCHFKGNDTYSYNNTFAIRYPSGENGFGLTVKDCTVDNKMFGFIWVSRVENGLVVDHCIVEGVQEAINLTSTPEATIKNSTISAKTLVVRAGQSSGSADGVANKITLEYNKLTSESNVIVLRGEAVDANLSMSENVVSGATHISGTTAKTQVSADANYWDGKAYPVVKGTEVKVNNYYSDEAKSNLVNNHFGGSIVGFVSENGIWGETWGNAFVSYEVKVLDANGNVMGTTTLNNVGNIIDGTVNVTWGINFVGASNDPYWTWQWTTRPSITKMPAKVQLWIDGENMVSEGLVQFNAADNVNKIVAVVTEADGTIISCHTSVANAAATNATNFALLCNTTEEYILPPGVQFNRNGFTADNVKKCIALIGTQRFASLQDAVNAVKNGETITLKENIEGSVHVNKSNVAFTIDGAISNTEKANFNGKIEINVGQNVTIKNIDFVWTDDAAHDFIGNVGSPTGKNYNTTLLIENCSFVGNGKDNVVAVRTIHPTSVQIKNCTATGMHSFLQNTGGQSVSVDGVTVTDSKGGLAIGSPNNIVTVKNCNLTTDTYGIRLDAVTAGTGAVLENNKISAYIPVSVRKASAKTYDLSFRGSESTYTASNGDQVWCAICKDEYEPGVALNPGTGNVSVELNDTGLLLSGVYGNFGVATIGKSNYLTFEEALAAVQDGETIQLTGVESNSELKKEIEFNKSISFTITGKAPKYALPVITFLNAKVTIKDAEILIPELDARQNAVINIVKSTVYDAGGDGIVKSYYNGAINIDENSTVYTMQVTTMGYINVKGTLNATWQTNVYGNGLINLAQGATFNTAALHLTGKDYSGRDNTDAERGGKPATIVVDGATLNVGLVKSNNGADYSYNSSKGINVGTIDGKSALLDIKNGGAVNFYMANGQTTNFGAGATVNVAASTLKTICRDANGTVTLDNKGTVNVTGASQLDVKNFKGNAINATNATLADVQFGGAVNAFGTNNISGTSTIGGMLSIGYNGNATEPIVVNITGNFNGTNVVVGNKASDINHTLNLGKVDGVRTKAHFGQLGVNSEANIANADVTYEYSFVRKNFNVINSALNNTWSDTYMALNAKVVLDNSSWNLGPNANIGSFGGKDYGNADVTLKNGSSMTAKNLGINRSGDYVVKVAIDETSSLTATNLTNEGEMNIAGTVTASTKIANTGTINFTSLKAKLVTPTERVVIKHAFKENYKIVYKEGAYSFGDFVAEINGTYYETIQSAFGALTEGATLKFLNNVTVDEAWDCRNNGALIAVAGVTIDGNGKTLKLTGVVEDMNWNTVFRVAANNATFKNLTIDASKAEKIQRGISAQLSITVDSCKFIGNGTTSKYGVIYGEGAGDFIGDVVATVTNSAFVNNSYGVSDNRNGQDAKSVTLTGNTFTNAKVLLSANEKVTFKNNTVNGASVVITSHKNATYVYVEANGNTLEATQANQITTNPARVTAQSEFAKAVATNNNVYYLTLPEAIEAVAADATIKMLADVTGAGAVINKNVTIDFDGKTYTFNKAVGSAGTETNGFQILKDNNVKLMNGTLTSTAVVEGKEVKMLIQNYANLTLEDMNLVDATDHILYALSNNSGDVKLLGNTNITTDAVAFDACKYGSYDAPKVTVNTTGTIEGNIECTATIVIYDGTFSIDVNPWCAEGLTAEPLANGYYSIVTGITIIDGQMTEFTNAEDKVVDYIRYERTLPLVNVWMPLYVPFSIPMSEEFLENYDIAYFNDVRGYDDNNDYTIDRTVIELIKVTNPNATLKANYPLVIRAKNEAAKNLVFALTNVKLHKAEDKSVTVNSTAYSYEIKGTYQTHATLTSNQRVLGMTQEGEPAWGTLADGYSLNPFRLFLTITSRGNEDLPFETIRMRVIGEDGENGITYIEEVMQSVGNGDNFIYDLQGRRVTEPVKGGLYIVNGKKVYYNK